MTDEAIEKVSVPSVDVFSEIAAFVEKHETRIILTALSAISVLSFLFFYFNGLGIAYNDARSHLDIGRRVVENLKPGLAQIGSVWLPLPHFLMLFTIWNNFMWHSGLSGAIVSMISYVGTGFFISKILKKLNVGLLGRMVGVFAYAANANLLYLQSTAMTELLFLFTFTASVYELISWYKSDNVWDLSKAAFWIMLSTLTRYDAWFLFVAMSGLVAVTTFFRKGFKAAEGTVLVFVTLGGFGMALWLLWNYLIFGDPLFSFFGPYSAYAQQKQIEEVGELITKWSVYNSTRMYLLTIYHINGLFSLLAAYAGMTIMILDRNMKKIIKFVTVALLLSPLFYNILALYLGHSIISVPHVFGDNWFNIRYGIVVLPSVAIFIGYLIHKVSDNFKFWIISVLVFVFVLSFLSIPVTIQDALWGASSKNVSQVSRWLRDNASQNEDKILISAGSHDAIIFSSGFDIKRFIHEGTGNYWHETGKEPDHWVRYIVMRTYDEKDATYSLIKDKYQSEYNLVLHGEFADIYEIKPENEKYLVKAEAFPADLNASKTKSTLLSANQTQPAAGALGVTSMLSVASTALFMVRIVNKPTKKKSKPQHFDKGDVDSEYASNITALRQAKIDPQ